MNNYPFDIKCLGRLIGSRILAFDELGSTNDYLKKNSGNLPAGTAVFARSQCAGRGRLGRDWLSSSGGLYMSFLLKESAQRLSGELYKYTFFPALAVERTLRELYGVNCALKWPNDVIIGSKKLCGILAEAVYSGDTASIIIGIGVNVRASTFEGELGAKAVSLRMSLGCDADISALAERLLDCLNDEHGRRNDSLLERYIPLCATIGREVEAAQNGERINGFAVGVAEDGSLLIETDEGTVSVTAGDVVTQGIY